MHKQPENGRESSYLWCGTALMLCALIQLHICCSCTSFWGIYLHEKVLLKSYKVLPQTLSNFNDIFELSEMLKAAKTVPCICLML